MAHGARRAMAAAHRSFATFLLEHSAVAHLPLATLPPAAEDAGWRAAWPPDDGFGETRLPERVVRGIVFARLADLLEGHAACRPEVAVALASMLAGPMPEVPVAGTTSAGEVLVLAHLLRGLPEVDLQEAEAVALLDGSPGSAALAADAALQAHRRLALAEGIFALSVEAMAAPLAAYDPALGRLWGDPFVAEALGGLNRWLTGAGPDRRPYQAPVSYRVLPPVLGQARRAAAQIDDVARSALGAVTLDQVFLPPTDGRGHGTLLSTGGSFAATAYPAMAALAATWADLCTLADRHTTKLHRGAVSLLPDRLAGPGGRTSTGLLGFVPVGLGERARHAAARTFLPPSEGGVYGGEEDVALPTFVAAERLWTAAAQLDGALAVLAAVASHALDLTDRPTPVGLGPLLAFVRTYVPPARAANRGAQVGRLAAALSDIAVTGSLPLPPAASTGRAGLTGPTAGTVP